MTATEWRLTIKDNVVTNLEQITNAADKASGKMVDLQNNVDKVGEGVKKSSFAANIFKDALGTAFGHGMVDAAKKAYAFFADSVKDFDAQDQALGQLRATWKSTGGSVGLSIKEITDQAEALQKTTLFPDEVTENAQALLMTFRNVRGEVFKSAMPAIMDLATKTKSDLGSTAGMIGKVLQEPEKGAELLRKSYRLFSEEQVAAIGKMVEGGKVQEAQMKILTALNGKFGGSAEAAAQSGTGFLTQLKNDFGDVKEVIGEMIVGIIKGAQPALQSITSGIRVFVEWIKEHQEGIGEIFKALAVGLTAVGAAFLLTKAYAAAYAIQQFLSIGLTSLQMYATFGLVVAWNKLKVAMKANAFGLILTGIGLAVAAVKYFWDTSENFRGFLYGLWASIKTIFTNIGTFFKTLFEPIIKGVQLLMEGDWWGAAKQFAKGLINIATPAGAVNAIKNGKYESVSESYNNAYKDGLHDFYVEKALEKSEKEKKEDGSAYASLFPESDETKLSESSKDIKSGLSDVSGGGKSVRNINVTIQRFTDKININSTTVREGANEIVGILEDALIRALSGAESAMATNGGNQ